MASDVVKGIREAIQDLLAPELRELRAEMRANTQRLEDVKSGLREMKDELKDEIRELKSEFREWRNGTDRRFEHIEHRLDTYEGCPDTEGTDGRITRQAAAFGISGTRAG